jgi:NTP pyrophosphatase (non-canonical NTP hydrolase)
LNAYEELKRKVLAFRDARDWQQFHDPKNLSEALVVEAGELLENFLWKTPEQSRALSKKRLDAVRSEIADVQIFLLYLGHELGVDPVTEANCKVDVNEKRYPVDRVRSSAVKHTELGG